jgi:hypothetical protein
MNEEKSVERLSVKAFSADPERRSVLLVHFKEDVNDGHREALLAAINAFNTRSTTPPAADAVEANPLNLEEIKGLMAKATKGPWKYGHLGTEVLWIGPDYNQTPVAHVDHDMEYARDNSRANAALIVAAVNALPALIELMKALEALLAQPNDMLSVAYATTVLRKAKEGRS